MLHNRFAYTLTLILLQLMLYQTAVAKEMQFDRINMQNGLPHNSVTSITQDTEGYMWFGTRNGLSMFDGYDFSTYHLSESPKSIISNHVTTITEDHLGVLWVGTTNGLTRINRRTHSFEHYISDSVDGALQGNYVHALYQDQMTNIWVSTQQGLNKLIRHRNAFQHFPFAGRVNQLISIQSSNNIHQVLLATEKGLYYVDFQADTIRPFIHSSSIKHATCFHRIHHLVYIGTLTQGVFKLNLNTWQISRVYNSPGNRNYPITGIESVNANELIFTTRGNGFLRYNLQNKSTIHYSTREGTLSNISDNSILSLYRSKAGIIWLGTELGGIHKHSVKKSSQIFKHAIQGTVITDITPDKDESHKLWMATDYQGLIHYNTSSNKALFHNHIVLESRINTLLNLSYNTETILIGTQYSGLFLYNKKTKSILPVHSDVFSGQSIIGIEEGAADDILIFTKSGFAHRLDKDFGYIEYILPYRAGNAPSPTGFTAIHKDPSDVLWIGLDNQSMTKLAYAPEDEQYKWEAIPDVEKKLQHNAISIYKDTDEILWIGSHGGNVILYNTLLHTVQELPSHAPSPLHTVYAFEQDNSGNIWLFSLSGTSKYDKSTERITHYPLSQFAPTFHSRRNPIRINNTIFLGQTNGLHYFSPDSLNSKLNKHLPPIVIREVRILKNDLESIADFNGDFFTGDRSSIALNYNQNSFQLVFSALDYIHPDQNQYAYQLIGYDTAYQHTSAQQRIATYHNLSPGEYTFHVIGSNNDNIWNEQGVWLNIYINKPFWLTWWFKALSFLLLSLLTLLLYKVISSYKKRRSEERVLKRAEETLFLKENQLRTLIDNLPDFIYIKDIDSNFILGNQKLANVMGVEHPDELNGKNDHDFYPKELADQYMMDELSVIENKQSLINRIEPGKDEYGNVIIVSTSKVPVTNDKNEVIGIVGIGRDITEIKKAEQKIQEQAENLQETNTLLEERQEEIVQQKEEIEYQRDELKKLNQTKDKFFSIIGHDLKNPFHAIIALSEMLLQDFNNLIDSEKIEMLSMIKGSSENAFNLLQNLLEWSKSQTENIEFYPEKISLLAIVEETLSILQINAQRKAISIHKNLSDTYIYADKNMLKTIIRNLVNNAIKFTHPKGNITISAKEINSSVQIIIQDDGIGMSEEVKSHLFSLDKLQSKTGTSGEIGTGLGLILCNEFVQKHNGSLLVESEENKGSMFTIQLPLAH